MLGLASSVKRHEHHTIKHENDFSDIKNSGNKANLKAESKHYKNTMNKYIN